MRVILNSKKNSIIIIEVIELKHTHVHVPNPRLERIVVNLLFYSESF